MISELAQAILARFNSSSGDTLRNALTGGLWFTQARPNVSFPYGVFTWENTTIDEICGTSGDGIEHATISVELYSNKDDGGVEIFSLADYFMILFDWQTLTMPSGCNYHFLGFQRKSIVNDGLVDNIWTITMEYELKFQH